MPILPMILVVLALVWAGLVLGVSFLATPVKFKARTMSHATGIEIGQVTFKLFARVEWALAAGLCLLAVIANLPVSALAVALLCALIVVVEGFVLLPELDARAKRIVVGETLEPTWHHKAYIWLECLKLTALVLLGVLAMAAL